MFLVRQAGGSWHEPATGKYANEKELQDLVKVSPSLLPGGAPLAIVDEFWIPGVGSVDLVGIDEGGAITLVECKLKANPEIRREVVGQVLAYAGGLWGMSYDVFAQTFENRAGVTLADAVRTATTAEVDDADLRAAIAQRLRAGEFRLVIAVDEITPELRLIVHFLNVHTVPSVAVLAVELAYAKDGDVEILASEVYGEESAQNKQTSSHTSWTATSFAAQVAERTSGEAQAVIKALLAHGETRGHHAYYGAGVTPGMSYRYTLGGKPRSVWALYLYETGPLLALQIGSIATWSPDEALAFVEAVRASPELAAYLQHIGPEDLNKFPHIPIQGVLDQGSAWSVLLVALDQLTATT